MARLSPDEQVWDATAALILLPSAPETITWALIALRGHLRPGHPALGLLEEHRAHLRGERSALTDEELAPLHAYLVNSSAPGRIAINPVW